MTKIEKKSDEKNIKKSNKNKKYVFALPSINDLPLSEVRVSIFNEQCQRKLVKCDLQQNPSTQCLSCSEFRAQCVNVSGNPLVHLDSKNSDFLSQPHFPPNTGVCLVQEDYDREINFYNKYTTRVVPGTVRNENNEIFLTSTTLCVNKNIVGKSVESSEIKERIEKKEEKEGKEGKEKVEKEEEKEEEEEKEYENPFKSQVPYHKAPCDKIRACAPHGMLLHPKNNLPVRGVEDIDFDISNSKKLKCFCAGDYRHGKQKDGTPTCIRNRLIKDCSVKLRRKLRKKGKENEWKNLAAAGKESETSIAEDVNLDYGFRKKGKDDTDVGAEDAKEDDEESIAEEDYYCVCNPTLSVNVKTIIDKYSIFEKGDDVNGAGFDDASEIFSNERSFERSYLFHVEKFFETVLEGRDHCIPAPGVESKNAAFGYSAITEMGGLFDDIGDAMGGHLVNSACLRKDGIDELGRYRKNRMYGGGVVSSSGSGSVSAFTKNGPEFRGKNVLREGGFSTAPNLSLKMVPSSVFSFPGLGRTSMEHSVALLSSSGRVYPGGVHMRDGSVKRKTKLDEEKTLVKFRIDGKVDDNDLKESESHDLFMQRMNDPGIVAGVYFIPSEHDMHETNYGVAPKRVSTLPPSSTLSLLRETRPPFSKTYLTSNSFRRSASFYPVVNIFRQLVGGGRVPVYLKKFFPTIYESCRTDEELKKCFDSDETMRKLDTLGGLLLEPTPIASNVLSSWKRSWVCEELSANSPKVTNFYSSSLLMDGIFSSSNALTGLIYNYFAKRNKNGRRKIISVPVPRIPFDNNLISNFNSHTTLFGLQQFDLENEDSIRYNFVNGDKDTATAVVETNTTTTEEGTDDGKMVKPDFFKHQLLSSENFLNGASIINYPPSSPVSFTEHVDFSKRLMGEDAREVLLKKFSNQYAQRENENRVKDYVAKRYAWEKVKKAACRQDFSVDNFREYGKSTFRPTVPALECYFQIMTQGNRRFVNTPEMNDRKGLLVHFSQHNKKHVPVYVGQYKYLSEGDGWLGANLNQYLPMFVPNDTTSYPTVGFLERAAFSSDVARRGMANVFHKFKHTFSVEKDEDILKRKDLHRVTSTCGCTCELVCQKRYPSLRSKIENLNANIICASAFLSRSNKLTPFVFQKRIPCSDPRLYAAYLRIKANLPLAQDPKEMFKPLAKNDYYPLLLSPNIFAVSPRDTERCSTYMWGRQLIEKPFAEPENVNSEGPPELVAGANKERHYFNLYKKLLPGSGRDDFHEEAVTRFLESLLTVMPSTICSNMFNSREDGAKDIVAQMGVPYSILWSKFECLKKEYKNNNIKNRKSRRPSAPLKFVHNYPVGTLSYAGFECGQTIAEGQHAMGGYLCPYRPWQEDNQDAQDERTTEGEMFREDAFKFRGKSRFFGELNDNEFLKTMNNKELEKNDVIVDLLRHYGVGCLFEIKGADTNDTSSYPMDGRFSYSAFPPTRQMTCQVRQPLTALGLIKNNRYGVDLEENS